MDRKPRIVALIVTVIVLAVSVGLLLSMSLRYSSAAEATREWPPVDSAELLFANEFVAAGEVAPVENPTEATPVAESAPALEAHDRTDAGPKGEIPPSVVSSNRPSAMTVKKQKEDRQAGNQKQEDAEAVRAKARKETSQAISKRVNFGGPAAGGKGESAPESSGKGGATDGIASASLGGRSMERWSKPSAKTTGTITVRVRVDRQGKVIRADYVSGTGAVASDVAARQSCESAALKSQFSVSLDGPAVQVGTITYRFR